MNTFGLSYFNVNSKNKNELLSPDYMKNYSLKTNLFLNFYK